MNIITSTIVASFVSITVPTEPAESTSRPFGTINPNEVRIKQEGPYLNCSFDQLNVYRCTK